MAEELPILVMAANNRLLSRTIGSISPEASEQDQWSISSPIPGVRVLQTVKIFKDMWLVLVVTEAGDYNIFWSHHLQSFTLVHSHGTRIYGIFLLDSGRAVFSAADGWWETTDAGHTWIELDSYYVVREYEDPVLEFEDWDDVVDLPGVPDPDTVVPEFDSCIVWGAPVSSASAIIQIYENRWKFVAYGQDHKIYACEYPSESPGGLWEEVFDTSLINHDKLYHAIAGGPAGILAGVGDQLIRSETGAEGTWQVIRTMDGIIKSILVSNQSTTPEFLITIESYTGDVESSYVTNDLGDTLTLYKNRLNSRSAVQSVIPTGTNEIQTMFFLIGKRALDSPVIYSVKGGE